MAAVSLLWNNNMAAVTSCENALCLFWAPNGLNELPEMRFEFPLILIGKKSWMAFLAGQLWHVLKCWYAGGGPRKNCGAVSQTGFTLVKFRLWCRLSQPQRSSRELAHSLTEVKLSKLLIVLSFVGFRPCGLRQNSTGCADGAHVRLPVHQDVHTGKHDWIYWECEMSNH